MSDDTPDIISDAQVQKSRDYVWCDVHGAIHDKHPDLYDEGASCELNWRPVYLPGNVTQ